LLSQGMLKGSDLTEFITRSVALMEQPHASVTTEAL
jgi:hypothetical protein